MRAENSPCHGGHAKSRRALVEARERLKTNDELSTKVGSAVYSIEAVSEDINMPMHARTQIWTILSALESIKSP